MSRPQRRRSLRDRRSTGEHVDVDVTRTDDRLVSVVVEHADPDGKRWAEALNVLLKAGQATDSPGDEQ